MAVNQENSCAFYASDYHLEMIMLPYINENLKENKNIYVFTQNNLENTMNELLNKINLKKETKNNILNINWKNDDKNKYNDLINDDKELTIFVKGNEDYIEKINDSLSKIRVSRKIEVVDCYNLEDIGDSIKRIAGEHKNVFRTNRNFSNFTIIKYLQAS